MSSFYIKSTINDNHTVYGSQDKNCNRHNFVILGHFLPIYPQNMEKTPGNIIKTIITGYTVTEI